MCGVRSEVKQLGLNQPLVERTLRCHQISRDEVEVSESLAAIYINCFSLPLDISVEICTVSHYSFDLMEELHNVTLTWQENDLWEFETEATQQEAIGTTSCAC